jgi:hypothetical protein
LKQLPRPIPMPARSFPTQSYRNSVSSEVCNRTLKEKGPMTPTELAAKTNVAERYAREWLSHQAASGYVEYEPATGKFTLPPEHGTVDPQCAAVLRPVEREVTGERIRDKIAASKKKGRQICLASDLCTTSLRS